MIVSLLLASVLGAGQAGFAALSDDLRAILRVQSDIGVRLFPDHEKWRDLKSKNEDLVYSWFVRGLADHFAMHLWDGKEFRLGVRHLLQRPHVAYEALEAFEKAGFDER